MKFISAISTAADARQAVQEVIDRLRSGLDAARADLVVVFTSGHNAAVFEGLAGRLGAEFPSASCLGCTAEGTIGDGAEIERAPSVAVLVAHLPGVRVHPFHVTQETLEGPGRWAEDLELETSERPVVLALGDPFTIEARDFLAGLNAAYPGCPVLGGLASQGRQPGQNRLLLGGNIHAEGLVAMALTGNIQVDTVVSQGCRPIGRPFIVTKGDSNIVRALRNLTAMDALKEVAQSLTSEEQELMQHGLFLGRAIDEYKSTYGRGDFLIQGVIGADPKSGALAIAGDVKVGTTVQFHVRDRRSADEDLRNLLQSRQTVAYEGALLFSCNGRGTRMWDSPGHDVGVLREFHRKIPVAGFFCAGELGPVGGQNFIHGFTASVGLFRPKD